MAARATSASLACTFSIAGFGWSSVAADILSLESAMVRAVACYARMRDFRLSECGTGNRSVNCLKRHPLVLL